MFPDTFLESQTAQLCMQGVQAEFEGDLKYAEDLFLRAWRAAQNNLDACVAAHYVARFQTEPNLALEWHKRAFGYLECLAENEAAILAPSLLVNLGYAHEVTGDGETAEMYYQRAAMLGLSHSTKDASLLSRARHTNP